MRQANSPADTIHDDFVRTQGLPSGGHPVRGAHWAGSYWSSYWFASNTPGEAIA